MSSKNIAHVLVRRLITQHRLWFHNQFAYVAGFTSLSDQNKGVVYTPGSTQNDPDNVGGNSFQSENSNRGDHEITADTIRDASGSVAEMVKSGVVGALETGLKIGETAKQILTDSVKEASSDSKKNGQPAYDKHVDDLRRKDGGYDLKNIN